MRYLRSFCAASLIWYYIISYCTVLYWYSTFLSRFATSLAVSNSNWRHVENALICSNLHTSSSQIQPSSKFLHALNHRAICVMCWNPRAPHADQQPCQSCSPSCCKAGITSSICGTRRKILASVHNLLQWGWVTWPELEPFLTCPRSLKSLLSLQSWFNGKWLGSISPRTESSCRGKTSSSAYTLWILYGRVHLTKMQNRDR